MSPTLHTFHFINGGIDKHVEILDENSEKYDVCLEGGRYYYVLKNNVDRVEEEPRERNPLIDPLNHCLTLLIDLESNLSNIHNNFPEKELHRPIEVVIEEAKEAIESFIHE